ncbi:alpha/beta hydrolase [Nitrosomonas sp. Nm34]|uniref:alpha/beta hydrolase n=1 Tax=Nitrosomonas sp. Nm34 TaxID=1881055 RepID=UPI0008F25699|nr:alpha/beta fold hydrolase [Nitrosomonas sp. Nm34]SFI73564.1 Prolyl oligopeptidase family protein [Nitrosomonas sp. Nm34]
MYRWILLQIASVLVAVVISMVIIGEILTGPASTVVGVLIPDFPVESVEIATSQNYKVHGWLARGIRGHGAVVLVHSIRSNRLEMLGRARFLNEQGYSVLLIDLQAHGETPGERITFGMRESKDVKAAVDYLRDNFPGERIAAIGVTLGAAAITLADPPLKLNAIVLESLHSTFEEAVENRLKLHLGEFGLWLKPFLLSYLSLLLDVSTDQLNPIDRISNLNAPILLISGTHDRHTTQSEAERLFDAALPPKELWIIPGAGHYNMHTYNNRSYEERVSSFLSKYLLQ